MPALTPELRDELDAAITRHHLDSVADEIRGNAEACYAMVTTGQDDYSTVGGTRFGGDPDLPAGATWPTDPDKDKPTYSNFIAQINFAELPPLSESTGLPSSGILYLFVRYMDAASEPVILDSLYFDGPIETLARRSVPDTTALCDEYLVNLIPQRIQAVPAVSLANYREHLRKYVDEHTQKVDGADGGDRFHHLMADMRRKDQIGQVLGFANAGDESENLYRQVALGRLGKRNLIYADYWPTMQAYDAYIEKYRHDERSMKYHEAMRDGVQWLISNREMIANVVDQWCLLFRIDSNLPMELNMNDADPLYVFIQQADLARADFSDLAGEVTQG